MGIAPSTIQWLIHPIPTIQSKDALKMNKLMLKRNYDFTWQSYTYQTLQNINAADFDNNLWAFIIDSTHYFVNKNGEVLSIDFSAYLDIHSKYAWIGRYFNMTTEQGVKVSLNWYSFVLLTVCGKQVWHLCGQKNELNTSSGLLSSMDLTWITFLPQPLGHQP